MLRTFLPVAVSLLWLGACSDSPPCGHDGGTNPGSQDASSHDASGPGMPDLMTRCELPFDVRAIDQVSTGAVSIMMSPGDATVWTAQIDATAGGATNYDKNPFVYIDLINRKQVQITDVQAQTSGNWDIAFKRWQIKIDSGDSGPGGVTVARIDGKALAEVTMAPTSGYLGDTYFDDKCMASLDPIGGLGTQLSDWYDYDTGTNRLVPKKQVLVFPRRDGQGHIKLQILDYYQGTTSGYFSLAWSYLP